MSEHRKEFILRTIGGLGSFEIAAQGRGLLPDPPPCDDLFGDVDLKHHHAIDLAAFGSYRQVGRIPVRFRDRALVSAVHPRACLAQGNDFTGSVYVLQHLDERLAAIFGERIEHSPSLELSPP